MVRRHAWLVALLALGLGPRLIEIDGPLIDQQAWRQTDTAAIARNFHEEGLDLLHPRVDWRGAGPGYVETNFPLYPFAVALLYRASGGTHEWLGRLLSALLSTGAALLLQALLNRFYRDPQVGRIAAILFLVTPMSWFFGRAFMPEAAMLFLSLAALLTVERWLRSRRRADLALAAASAALCYLIKIPTLYLGLPILYLVWHRHGIGFLRVPALWLYAALSLAPAALWYTHAAALHGQTGLTFGIWGATGYDKWAHHLLLETDYYALLLRRIGHYGLTPVGAGLAALGLWASLPLSRQPGGPSTRDEAQPGPHLLLVWLAAVVVYMLLVPEGNRKLHYYQLPLVPVAASLAALPLAALLGGAALPRPRWLTRAADALGLRVRTGIAVALVLATAGYSAWAVRAYYRPGNNVYEYYRSCLAAGRVLDRSLPAAALVVVGDLDENAGAPDRAQSPSMLYYLHRKGWQITPDQFAAPVLDSLAALGATHFVCAGRFAMENEAFWGHLLERGVAAAPEYPALAHSHRGYLAGVRRHPGGERHFVAAPLAVKGPPQRP